VDDRIHAPDSIDLVRNVPRVGGGAEIADDDACGTRG
jgi:hypothetical protein